MSQSKDTFLEGHFLISEADLMDPNFHRTVILLVQHSTEGAFGLVLNRSWKFPWVKWRPILRIPLHRSCPSTTGVPAASVRVLSPLRPPSRDHGQELQLSRATCGLPTLCRGDFGLPQGHVVRPVRRGQAAGGHLYAGYSGWAPGQLEDELERGSWIVNPRRPNTSFIPILTTGGPRPWRSWVGCTRSSRKPASSHP